MLSITRISATGQSSSTAVLAYLKATEYYVGKDGQAHSSSCWTGKGATVLMLQGDVDIGVMDHLARGFAPDGTTPLCRNAGEEARWKPKLDKRGLPVLDSNGDPRGKWEGGHRVGFDLTFSSEKTFSLLYAMAPPQERERLLEAHHRAVEQALAYVERQVETRRGKGGVDKMPVAGLVVSRHTHFAGREEVVQDGAAAWDPQLHSHCLVYGVAQGKDGQWSTFDAEALYEQKMTAGSLYRAELAHQVRALGYGVEKVTDVDVDGRETGKVYLRVAGIPESMRDAFSKRRSALLNYMAEHPEATAQAATLATRKSKDEPTYAELTQLWAQAIDGMARAHPELPTRADQLKGRPSFNLGAVDDEALLKKLHTNTAVFARKDLLFHLAQEHLGQLDLAGVEKEADAFLERMSRSRQLVHIDPLRQPEGSASASPGRKHTEVRYAARWVVDLEQQLVTRTRARRDDATVRVEVPITEQAITDLEARKGFQMSNEQKDAVRYLTSGSGGTAVLVGRAGAGKTTSVAAAVDAWQANGQHVIGVATAWKAAGKLQAETGVESVSVASLLTQIDKGTLRLTPQSVLLLDEAGMVGTEQLVALQQHVDAAKGKLVLMGDPKQLQPVDWGGGLRLAQAEGAAELTEIRRQSARSDRDTANLFYELPSNAPGARSRRAAAEQGQKIWSKLEAQGQLDGHDTKKKAMDQLVHDVLASRAPMKDKLVLGASRQDVEALNQALRAGLKQSGQLSAVDYAVTAPNAEIIKVAIGERLTFTRRSRDLGVVNGDTCVVQSVRQGQRIGFDVEAVIESDIVGQSGRLLRWNTEELKGGNCFVPAYASTVHKAQGASVSEVYQLANPGMADEQLSLVGFSRMKNRFKIYGAHDDLEMIADRYGMDRLALNATEEGVRLSARERPATLESSGLAVKTPTPLPIAAALERGKEADAREVAAILSGSSLRERIEARRAANNASPPKTKAPLDAYVTRVKAWVEQITSRVRSQGSAQGLEPSERRRGVDR
ncbi:relaxase domain-containing protein [Bacillus sp. NP157]|nr:relaxase domain-containing protein [Bacillus sp. NP157]